MSTENHRRHDVVYLFKYSTRSLRQYETVITNGELFNKPE